MKNLILTFVFTMLSAMCFAQTKIAVGIAYVKQNKTGCKQFTEAAGYEYRIENSANVKMTDLRNDVENKLKAKYVNPDVIMKTANDKKIAVIVSYTKPINGYDCKKNSFAVGLGNTFTEAREAAIKEMRLYYDGSDWKQIRVIE